MKGLPIDFVGEVQDVTFDPSWTMAPSGIGLASGGVNGVAVVGPQMLILATGQRLHIPKGTPGGNTCLKLIHPPQVAGITGEPGTSIEDVPRFESNRDWTVPCFVIGQQHKPSGDVTWFAVLEAVRGAGGYLGEVGIVDRLDPETQTIVTSDGYELPTDVLESDCGAPLDARPGTMALVDPTTGRVASLQCLGDG